MRCPHLVLPAAVALLATLAVSPTASAHEGGSNCRGTMVQEGSSWEGKCSFPFQGFPIGVAGVYDSNPAGIPDPPSDKAEIHVELLAKLAGGVQRPLSVECLQTTTGIARCELESNQGTTDFTAPEPLPSEIVSITCSAHSHASWSTFNRPAGAFACWSTDEARADLVADKWFSDNGFGSAPPPEPEPEPEPGPLEPLAGAGASGVITTVPTNTYAPDTLVVSRSLGLSYVNADLASHDVVALEAKRPNGSAPWCAGREPGTCPLFWSELIAGGGSQTPVLGLGDTKVGQSYRFYCSIHPYMVGSFQVVE